MVPSCITMTQIDSQLHCFVRMTCYVVLFYCSVMMSRSDGLSHCLVTMTWVKLSSGKPQLPSWYSVEMLWLRVIFWSIFVVPICCYLFVLGQLKLIWVSFIFKALRCWLEFGYWKSSPELTALKGMKIDRCSILQRCHMTKGHSTFIL